MNKSATRISHTVFVSLYGFTALEELMFGYFEKRHYQEIAAFSRWLQGESGGISQVDRNCACRVAVENIE